MYDSSPRPVEGQPIEEVLPAAINATATSEKESRAATELARRQHSEEPRMAVMRSGSPQWLQTPLPTGVVLAIGLVLLVALVTVLVVLI